MINENDSMKNLTDKQKQKYIADLQQFKMSHSTSVRASNTAAACDVHATLNRIFREVHVLGVKFISERLNSLPPARSPCSANRDICLRLRISWPRL